MRAKTKIIILVAVCLAILVGAIIINNVIEKQDIDYFAEIKYNDLIKKIENKDTFVFLISQTTCSHCLEFKPKLSKVANEYKVMVYYIEVDLLSTQETENLKKYFSYNGTPQTVFVVDGDEKTAASRINGNKSEEKIISKFKSNGFIK